MKGRNLLFVGLIATLVGLVLVLFRYSLVNGDVVKASGVLFVLAGILNMTVFLASRDKEGKARMGAFGIAFGWVASAAAVVLGLSMLLFVESFVVITGFMFGVLLVFAALFQVFLLFFGTRPVRLSDWFFLVPAILICASIFLFVWKPAEVGEHVIMTVAGSSFMFFGLLTMLEGTVVGKRNHDRRKKEIEEEQLGEADNPEIPETEESE